MRNAGLWQSRVPAKQTQPHSSPYIKGLQGSFLQASRPLTCTSVLAGSIPSAAAFGRCLPATPPPVSSGILGSSLQPQLLCHGFIKWPFVASCPLVLTERFLRYMVPQWLSASVGWLLGPLSHIPILYRNRRHHGLSVTSWKLGRVGSPH